MTVQELIEQLKQYDPNLVVTAWNAFYDCESSNVFLEEGAGKLLIRANPE